MINLDGAMWRNCENAIQLLSNFIENFTEDAESSSDCITFLIANSWRFLTFETSAAFQTKKF